MTSEEMDKAAAALVADWPTPTRQMAADIATLMRPGFEEVRRRKASQRTTVRKAA